jgi:hypothetical protein
MEGRGGLRELLECYALYCRMYEGCIADSAGAQPVQPG